MTDSPKEVFLRSLSELRQRGLVNIRFDFSRNCAASEDEIYAEINRMLSSKKSSETEDL